MKAAAGAAQSGVGVSPKKRSRYRPKPPARRAEVVVGTFAGGVDAAQVLVGRLRARLVQPGTAWRSLMHIVASHGVSSACAQGFMAELATSAAGIERP
ncbi:MAG: hypothetical protein ABI601_21360 [bacterium]